MKLKIQRFNFWLVPTLVVILVATCWCCAHFLPGAFAEQEPSAAEHSEYFVTIFEGDNKLIVKSAATTVDQVLSRLGITYSDYDIIEPALGSTINHDNFEIYIYHARQVLLIDGSRSKYVLTTTIDPRAIFEAAGITVYSDDIISAVPSTPGRLLEVGLVDAYELTRGEIYAEVKAKQAADLVAKQAAEEAAARAAAYEAKIAHLRNRPNFETCSAWAREAGISEDDLPTALTLIYRESGCRPAALNASSGAYGIPQALPGSKMASIADDWETNPVTQIRWMIQYVTGRYGGWGAALEFWNQKGWY